MWLLSSAREVIENAMDNAAVYRPGQTLLDYVDDGLSTVQKCASWAVPPPVEQDERPQVEMIRPLPWPLFLLVLFIIRITIESISLFNLLFGKPPLRPADAVTCIISTRRYFRKIKYKGLRRRRARDMAQYLIYSSFRKALRFILCIGGPTPPPIRDDSNDEEVIVPQRSDLVQQEGDGDRAVENVGDNARADENVGDNNTADENVGDNKRTDENVGDDATNLTPESSDLEQQEGHYDRSDEDATNALKYSVEKTEQTSTSSNESAVYERDSPKDKVQPVETEKSTTSKSEKSEIQNEQVATQEKPEGSEQRQGTTEGVREQSEDVSNEQKQDVIIKKENDEKGPSKSFSQNENAENCSNDTPVTSMKTENSDISQSVEVKRGRISVKEHTKRFVQFERISSQSYPKSSKKIANGQPVKAPPTNRKGGAPGKHQSCNLPTVSVVKKELAEREARDVTNPAEESEPSNAE